MEIRERIYGDENVEEKVLIDLINSPSVQRLKDISQLGMPDKYSWKKGFSRYEHSVGVMVLLKKLGASVKEQIAGLLHDVSHTTFSHVIDWVVGNPEKEDYQDNTLLKIIQNSEIPKILEDYNFNYKEISNHNNFSLLEKEAPSLCADRIDYSLRELTNEKGEKISKEIYKNLAVRNNQIIFKNQNTAEIFAKEYMLLQTNSWAGNQARTRYYLFSEILKKGLETNLINFKDFEKTENYLLNKLENSDNNYIKFYLNLLKKGFDVLVCENGVELRKKFRYVDPEILVNGSYKSLSKLSKSYLQFLNIEKEKSKLIKKIKIIPK